MKYFGTDGIRGNANEIFTKEFILKLSNAIISIINENDKTKKVIIAKDTRESSNFIEEELKNNFLEKGINVDSLGVTTTPNLSFILENKFDDYSYGIMISASHNPFMDNGIKIFDHNGKKIIKEEKEIEEKIDNNNYKFDKEEKGVFKTREDLVKNYIQSIRNQINFINKKIVFDLANGSASKIAKEIFKDKIKQSIFIGDSPNGKNINDKLGSTNIKQASKIVVENNFDMGIAYDGDGDRIIAIDKQGNEINGDKIMYALTKQFIKEDKINNNKVVITEMSNQGLINALEKISITPIITPVGDKYVADEIIKNKLSLGGEQSGHIIIKERSMTGDGIMVSGILLNIFNNFKDTNDMFSDLVIFPQILKNFKVNNKKEVLESEIIKEFIEQKNKIINNNGKILLRASGTENLIRFMVETNELELANQIIDEFTKIIEEKYA